MHVEIWVYFLLLSYPDWVYSCTTDASFWTSCAVGISSWYMRKYCCAIFLACRTKTLKIRNIEVISLEFHTNLHFCVWYKTITKCYVVLSAFKPVVWTHSTVDHPNTFCDHLYLVDCAVIIENWLLFLFSSKNHSVGGLTNKNKAVLENSTIMYKPIIVFIN